MLLRRRTWIVMLGMVAASTFAQQTVKTYYVTGAGIEAGENMKAKGHEKGTLLDFVIVPRQQIPYTQSCVLQSTEHVKHAPDSTKPYFCVRYALPIPPSYTKKETATLTGLDWGVYHHNHSPGFEVLENGDALAIYFSTPYGLAENDTATTWVQARLRYGSEEWDMPELYFATLGGNDQSALLWRDENKLWFFGGGRDYSDAVPFRLATSTDQGATWKLWIPRLDQPASDYTAQPITNAFRDKRGCIYMAMDGKESESFLWRSCDEGLTWHDMGGRTSGRHSTIVPLDDKGTLLSIGGKNNSVEGWTPQNISHDWGKTWEKATAAPFPQLGSGQRPSLIRLKSGALLFVSDGYLHKHAIAAPAAWTKPYDAFVAISKDNGQTWHYKTLPAGLPQDNRQPYTSIGYSTVRQSPNGIIHVLGTKTVPGLHYEFNEAWVWSEAGDIVPPKDDGKHLSSYGTQKTFSENYPNGQLKATWGARICPNGRYLLNGLMTEYYPDGTLQHQVTYQNGRKIGHEVFMNPNGTKRWTWERSLVTNHGVWTHYWPNGNKKIQSQWLTYPQARDAHRHFYGYVADGPTHHFDETGQLLQTYQFHMGELQ